MYLAAAYRPLLPSTLRRYRTTIFLILLVTPPPPLTRLQMLKTKGSRADFFHSEQKRILILNGVCLSPTPANPYVTRPQACCSATTSP